MKGYPLLEVILQSVRLMAHICIFFAAAIAVLTGCLQMFSSGEWLWGIVSVLLFWGFGPMLVASTMDTYSMNLAEQDKRIAEEYIRNELKK